MATRIFTFFHSAAILLTVLLSSALSASADDSLFFNEPTIDANTIALMRHHKIRRLILSDKVDEHIFDDPTLLPGLEEVSLGGSAVSNNLLRRLSENFPNIKRLTIAQLERGDAITANSIRLIGQFKNLQSLDLQCLLAPEETDFAQYFPSDLRRLGIDANAVRTGHSLELPALRELELRGSVDSKLLNSLQLPMLKTLTLHRGGVEGDTFENVGRFKHLDQVNVGWQGLAPEDSKILRRHHIQVHIGPKPIL